MALISRAKATMNDYSPNEFEDFLKEKSDQYLIYPSDEVWGNVEKKIHSGKAWIYVSVILLMLGISGSLVMFNVEEQKEIPAKTGQIAYRFIENDPIEKIYKQLHGITIAGERKGPSFHQHFNHNDTPIGPEILTTKNDQEILFEEFSGAGRVEIPYAALKLSNTKPKKLKSAVKPEKRNIISSTFETVMAKAKQISKNVTWQVYATPTSSYRKLTGFASATNFQYSSASFSTNSIFARDVNDAVRHKPGIGFEIGTAMFYPLTKRLSLKTGLQVNYNHYQIEAYSGFPEIATYGVNNVGFGGRVPINTISYYRNSDGYKAATLRNEHYMISMPVGLDYMLIGGKKINLSVASTIQPTYVFANYSYLISSNLKNYAKEPSLNRRWNINAAFEASLNIQQGNYKWSLSPQYRYQLISSFKNKYPIKENLLDIGLKVGIIKTIR